MPGNLFPSDIVFNAKPTFETMKFSLFILIAGLSLACSSAETSAVEHTSPEKTETPVEAAEPQTAENVTLSSLEEPGPEPKAAHPKDDIPMETKEEIPNVNLASSSPAVDNERSSGPTITEATGPTATTNNEPKVVVEEGPAPEIMPKSEPDHAIWDNLLRNFVSSSGQVNYGGLKNSPGPLNDYLQELESYPPQGDWSRNQIMAYWINAYNAYTIKLIVDNYPVKSIKDIYGGDPWNQKWIKIGGDTYSLNQIENDILRARYGDARIHFAVNCAAASCPPIHNRAFTAANLNSTLQRLTRGFINNSAYNSISENRIEISKIFEWYAGDFGNIQSYINGYTDVEVGAGTRVSYKEYDWALNGR